MCCLQILKAHPEINKLMGPCPYTKYQIALVVSMQVGLNGHALARRNT